MYVCYLSTNIQLTLYTWVKYIHCFITTYILLTAYIHYLHVFHSVPIYDSMRSGPYTTCVQPPINSPYTPQSPYSLQLHKHCPCRTVVGNPPGATGEEWTIWLDGDPCSFCYIHTGFNEGANLARNCCTWQNSAGTGDGPTWWFHLLQVLQKVTKAFLPLLPGCRLAWSGLRPTGP
jgi:hypothetical protein